MRPFIPQTKVNYKLLLKLMMIYGMLTLILLMCLQLTAIVVSDLYAYKLAYMYGGLDEVIKMLMSQFGGMESAFGRESRIYWGIIMIAFGMGGLFAVIHYIFVRKRRSIIADLLESGTECPRD